MDVNDLPISPYNSVPIRSLTCDLPLVSKTVLDSIIIQCKVYFLWHFSTVCFTQEAKNVEENK